MRSDTETNVSEHRALEQGVSTPFARNHEGSRYSPRAACLQNLLTNTRRPERDRRPGWSLPIRPLELEGGTAAA